MDMPLRDEILRGVVGEQGDCPDNVGGTSGRVHGQMGSKFA